MAGSPFVRRSFKIWLAVTSVDDFSSSTNSNVSSMTFCLSLYIQFLIPFFSQTPHLGRTPSHYGRKPAMVSHDTTSRLDDSTGSTHTTFLGATKIACHCDSNTFALGRLISRLGYRGCRPGRRLGRRVRVKCRQKRPIIPVHHRIQLRGGRPLGVSLNPERLFLKRSSRLHHLIFVESKDGGVNLSPVGRQRLGLTTL